MAGAQDRISILPSLTPGVSLQGNALVPISQYQYGTTGTLMTFKVSAQDFAGVAFSAATGTGFVAYTGGTYVNRILIDGVGTYVNNGDGSANPSVNIANTGVTAGTYGSVSQLPVISVNAQGQLTGVSLVTISAGGTVTDVTITGTTNEVSVSGTGTTTSSGSYVIGLPALIDLTGKTISGGAISGAAIDASTIGATTSATGSFSTAQVVTLAFNDGSSMTTAAGMGSLVYVGTQSGLTGGPITTSGTLGLETVAVTPGTYGSASLIPVITIDAFGRTTSATTAAVAASGGTDVLQVQLFS